MMVFLEILFFIHWFMAFLFIVLALISICADDEYGIGDKPRGIRYLKFSLVWEIMAFRALFTSFAEALTESREEKAKESERLYQYEIRTKRADEELLSRAWRVFRDLPADEQLTVLKDFHSVMKKG